MVTFMLLGVLLACATALPLAWKWDLGLVRVGTFVIATGTAVALAVTAVDRRADLPGPFAAGLVWAVTLTFATGVLAYRFYRDPEREPLGDVGAIVSPADGQVIYVRQAPGGVLPAVCKQGRTYTLEELTRTPLRHRDAIVVGIAMNFLDVHVNRAPIAGTVTLQRHIAGGFGSLRRPDMVFMNERATTVLEQDGLQVAVVQIASRLVRQIASFVTEGQRVALGQRIGVIRFGSQVDVVLPARPDLNVAVRPGARVRAGVSTVATLRVADQTPDDLAPGRHPGRR